MKQAATMSKRTKSKINHLLVDKAMPLNRASLETPELSQYHSKLTASVHQLKQAMFM